MNFQPITISEFGSVAKRELRGVWVIETPYTGDAYRTGYSDAHSASRSSKASARVRTLLSQQAAENFLTTAYSKREKTGTLPLKTEVTWNGVSGWLSPAKHGDNSGRYTFWPADGSPATWLITEQVNSESLIIVGDED